MSSFKRRRSISIDLSLIRILKDEATRRGEGSHTALLSKMLLGQAESLAKVIIAPEMTGKSKSVSMKESVWLSIKSRSECDAIGASAVGFLIITGKAPPLTPEEVEAGEGLAKEREEKRRSEPDSGKKRKSRAKPVEKPNEESAKKESDKPIQTTRIKPEETRHLKLVPSEIEEEDEERKKRRSKLSKGVPIKDADIAPGAAFKDLNSSEEEYLGGVWSL